MLSWLKEWGWGEVTGTEAKSMGPRMECLVGPSLKGSLSLA